MAWRPHGHARVNPDNPRAWATCDRCGFNFNHYMLQWQYQWTGFKLTNLRILVCDSCLDKPAPFLQAIILPPDPPPLFNVRPEPYALDEAGPTQTFSAEVTLDATSVSAFYLDLFDGDPTDGGSSVLETITGSAARTNYSSSMSAVASLQSTNTAAITFTTSAEASADLSWLAVYDAASGGNLLGAAEIAAPQTVVLYNGLSIPVGNLVAHVESLGLPGQWDFTNPLQSGQILTY